MIPYFLLVTLPVLARLISKKYRITSGKKTLCETQTVAIDIFMLLFLLLLALRGVRCGNDTRQYMRLFQEYGSQTLPQLLSRYTHEWGYKLLNSMIAFFTDDFQILLAATAAMCVFPLWSFYRNESENQILTVLLFLGVAPFMMYFSGIRQAIAISLGVPAWYAAKSRKLVRFILTILLAMQFHTSAFMLLVIYPLYSANITKKWLWAVVPCMVVVYIFKTPIFNTLRLLLWQEYYETVNTGATSILLLLILFGIYSYVLPDEKNLDKDTIALRNLLLLSTVLQIFAMIHPLSMRMNYYFLIFVPILIPKIANRSKKQFAQIAQLSVIVLIVYFLYYFVNSVITDKDSLNIYPYIPFWKN